MAIRFINPILEIGHLLLNVEKPARYIGGEYGRLSKKQQIKNNTLKTIIAFPDLYEIGMSNQALRIIYKHLNKIEGISCDRAFAPAPDFEKILKEKDIPLYGLDTGISLKNADILMFTLGYELGLTGIFAIMNVCGIPLRCQDRGEKDPIILIGGPCVSNPLPYSLFIDAFWIGEAEGEFFELASNLAEIKKSGADKKVLLEKIISHQSVWTKGKNKAIRAIDNEFSLGKNGPAIFPVPSMKVVHHHGSVEIMRGCPNACRFCHSGYWYRPMRQKKSDIIETEAEAFIKEGGYREITLSSLSSGDYQYLGNLIHVLNYRYKNQNISFQLPSLKVSSFSMDILDKISQVRNSGLTFAVETPLDFWQMSINKNVGSDDLGIILKEAKKRGWRLIKFYFMLGLPLDLREASEEEEIAIFIERMAKISGLRFNINISTFVPKPHTPFQWSAQMSKETAEKKFNYLFKRLKPLGHKLGVQDPLISMIEGIASRGDERAGLIFEQAFNMGTRLDAWSDYIKKEVWEKLIQINKDYINEILGEKAPGIDLPWSCISSNIKNNYFEKELINSRNGETTPACMKKCKNPCGACQNKGRIVQNIIQSNVSPLQNIESIHTLKIKDPETYRILFSFYKQGTAVFQPHLGLVEIFSMAFIRAGIPILYSRGFNPLPRLEIASPLSLGIKAGGEIAAIDTEKYFNANKFKTAINRFLPEGLKVIEAMNVLIQSGAKKHSVSSLLWGFVYDGKDGKPEMVKAKEEKAYRLSRICSEGSVFDLERLSVLAHPVELTGESTGESYFKVYRELYG